MANLSVIVLAAGKGTRMKSDTPKHLHKIGGLEIVHHIINTAEKLNAEDIIVVCNEENIDHIKSDKIKKIIQVEKKGTAHATQIGYDLIKNKNNDILVMYGDIPLVKFDSYQKMIDKLQEKDVRQVGAVFRTRDTKNRYGRITTNGDCIAKNVEFKDCTDEEKANDLCNGGIVALKGNILGDYLKRIDNNNSAKEYYLTDTINLGKKDGYLSRYVIISEDEIQGINSREDLSIAEQIFQNEKRKEFMAKGITLLDPATIYFSYDTEINDYDVTIEQNVIIGVGVKIKKNVVIKAFSYLEGCVLEEGVSVGPFARIRSETTLKQNSHIGNFVEIKKSTIGEETKIGHLSYIGDTIIGKKTNIGAGTITCNYDGFKKNKTEIGNECFIGSNTIIVAPNKIDDGALTGAGSVITENVGVEKNDLAVARAELKVIKGGADKYRKDKNKK